MIEKAMAYCRDVLKNVSRSFSLTIPLLEKNILVPVLVGYLEARLLDSFEDGSADTKERSAYIGKVLSVINQPQSPGALQDMKDVAGAASAIISNPHYLDLAQNMDKVMEVHRTIDAHDRSAMSLWFGRMAEGMQKYLNESIETFDQLDEYCYYVGGTVGGLVTDLVIKRSGAATAEQVQVLRMEQVNCGLFLQKVNIIRDFREDLLKNEKIFWPAQAFRDQGIQPNQALDRTYEPQALQILNMMIANAEKHIVSIKRYISAVPTDFPGFRDAALINFLMGVETLTKLRGNPDVFYSDAPVKIDRQVAGQIQTDPLGYFERALA